MGTTFSDVLLNDVMTLIDDITWREELALSPAAFLRAKSLYLVLGIPRFNHPPEAQLWLRNTPPVYDDYAYTAQTDETAPVVLETGLTGFDLCSVTVRTQNGNDVQVTPVNASDVTYDTGTGRVTVETALSAGQTLDVDFYKDGVFERELTGEMRRILALCVQTVWENRFSGEFLARTMKISDKTFVAANESTWTREQQAKGTAMMRALNDELARFEQNLAARQVIPMSKRLAYPEY